jgi:hypothetical protein
MCDFHLVIHMFLYVYVADPGNGATKSWLALANNQDKYRGEGASNRRRAFNRVRLLLVPQ